MFFSPLTLDIFEILNSFSFSRLSKNCFFPKTTISAILFKKYTIVISNTSIEMNYKLDSGNYFCSPNIKLLWEHFCRQYDQHESNATSITLKYQRAMCRFRFDIIIIISRELKFEISMVHRGCLVLSYDEYASIKLFIK